MAGRDKMEAPTMLPDKGIQNNHMKQRGLEDNTLMTY